MPRITAYHVSTESNLSTIESNVCDDPDRDGSLYGATVACFTTTLYNGALPTFSPYPRSHKEGEYGYRYRMKFNPEHYNRFLMAKTTQDGVEQVHFLLLEKTRPREKVVAAFVTAFLRATKANYNESAANADWERYFPNGKANEYTPESRVFVNVMFWHRVPVKKARVDGSHKIIKKGPSFQRESVSGNTGWFERLLADMDDNEVDELTRGLNSAHI